MRFVQPLSTLFRSKPQVEHLGLRVAFGALRPKPQVDRGATLPRVSISAMPRRIYHEAP